MEHQLDEKKMRALKFRIHEYRFLLSIAFSVFTWISDKKRRGKAALITASRDSESARLTDSSSSGRVTSGCSSISGGGPGARLLQPDSAAVGWDSSSSYADGNTEDPSGYMDHTLTQLDEAQFQVCAGGTRSGRGGCDAISISEDSIIDADYTARLHQRPADEKDQHR